MVYWPLHLLSDNGSYIAKIVWNILLTGLPLGIAFIPTSKVVTNYNHTFAQSYSQSPSHSHSDLLSHSHSDSTLIHPLI